MCACSKVVRKSIARLLTVISQQQRSALREVFKGKVSLLHSGELGVGMYMSVPQVAAAAVENCKRAAAAIDSSCQALRRAWVTRLLF